MTKLPTFASRAPDVADEPPLRRELVFVVPGRLDQLTGGYLVDRHIVEGLRARGWAVRVIELTGGRPKANAAVLAGVADGTETVVDGLALANLGEVVAAQARRLPVVAFVHGPLAQESGLPPAEAKRAAQREAALLSRLRGVLCPSRNTAAAVESYGVSPDPIAIVPPGTVKPNRYLRPRQDIVDPPSIIKLFQEHPSDIPLVDSVEVIRMQEAVALLIRPGMHVVALTQKYPGDHGEACRVQHGF